MVMLKTWTVTVLETGNRLGDMTKQYDVMVRVNYSYENEYGDRRDSWAVSVGLVTSENPGTIEEMIDWCASQMEFNPGEPVKRIIFTEVALYTVNEVK